MNKNDLIILVSEKLGKTKKEVTIIIDKFLEEISKGLSESEKITLSNFGTFERKDIKAFDIYSPYDGKLIKGVKQTRIHFKSSSNLKNKLNEKSPS